MKVLFAMFLIVANEKRFVSGGFCASALSVSKKAAGTKRMLVANIYY